MREYLLGGIVVQVFHIDLAREPLRNDWLDKIGAFWLMACVFGPFFD